MKKIAISRNDGFGAQLQAIMTCIAYCKYHNYEYIHIPVDSIGHNYSNDETFAQDLEIFSNMGYQFRKFNSLNIFERLFVRKVQHIDGEIHYSTNPDRYFTGKVRSILRENYYSSPKPNINFFSKDYLNIAIHIRRGDVDPSKKMRYDSNKQYVEIIDRLKLYYKNEKYRIFIFSEGPISDFEDIKKTNPDVTLKLNGDLKIAFHSLVIADVLVLSRSSFSYPAALLSRNTVYSNLLANWWHFPLKSWGRI